jgi:hypothetical protein
MSLALYMDHNVIRGITEGCRARGIDTLTASADGYALAPDEDILARAWTLNRTVFTHDVDFVRLAGEWLAEGRRFAGVVYGHQTLVSIGSAVRDLELICRALTEEDIANQLLRLPL